jgi:hypothetical protein
LPDYQVNFSTDDDVAHEIVQYIVTRLKGALSGFSIKEIATLEIPSNQRLGTLLKSVRKASRKFSKKKSSKRKLGRKRGIPNRMRARVYVNGTSVANEFKKLINDDQVSMATFKRKLKELGYAKRTPDAFIGKLQTLGWGKKDGRNFVMKKSFDIKAIDKAMTERYAKKAA